MVCQEAERVMRLVKSAFIKSVGGEGSLRQHFLDMGVIPGAEVRVMKYAPMGDPIELMIHGYELTLRLADAMQIEIDEDSIHVDEDFEDPQKRKALMKQQADLIRSTLKAWARFVFTAAEKYMKNPFHSLLMK